MAIEFDVTENKPDTRPGGKEIADTRLVRVQFRPLPGSPIHSNIFHMQLFPTGSRLLIDGRGRLVTESGKLIVPDERDEFPEESPDDPFRRVTFNRNNDAEMTKHIEAYWGRKLKATEEGNPYPQHHQSTITRQVAASADDGRIYNEIGGSEESFSTTSRFIVGTHTFLTRLSYDAWARFIDISGLSGASIASAIFTITGHFA